MGAAAFQMGQTPRSLGVISCAISNESLTVVNINDDLCFLIGVMHEDFASVRELSYRSRPQGRDRPDWRPSSAGQQWRLQFVLRLHRC
jgi:hypothetical protein